MRKIRFVKGIALALCMLSLTGCGAVNSQNENMENISESFGNRDGKSDGEGEKREKPKSAGRDEGFL